MWGLDWIIHRTGNQKDAKHGQEGGAGRRRQEDGVAVCCFYYVLESAARTSSARKNRPKPLKIALLRRATDLFAKSHITRERETQTDTREREQPRNRQQRETYSSIHSRVFLRPDAAPAGRKRRESGYVILEAGSQGRHIHHHISSRFRGPKDDTLVVYGTKYCIDPRPPEKQMRRVGEPARNPSTLQEPKE